MTENIEFVFMSFCELCALLKYILLRLVNSVFTKELSIVFQLFVMKIFKPTKKLERNRTMNTHVMLPSPRIQYLPLSECRCLAKPFQSKLQTL